MSARKENSDSKNQNGLPCPECEGQLILQPNSSDTDGNEMDHQFLSCSSCELHLEIQLEDDLPKNGTKKRFQCDICYRLYATPITLKVHRLLHTTGKNELCDFCGASFKTRGQLNIHRRVHTGEKPYKCNECDKSFPYRESLITHSTVHTRIKPFLCVACNARFSCIGNLLKHRRTRPNKCGLDSIPIKHIGPRPTKKTMPSLSDRQNKEPHRKETTVCLTDAVETNEIVEVCQDETDSLSDHGDATPTLYTNLSAGEKLIKDEAIPEDHDRFGEEEQNLLIVEYETTKETESDANDAKYDASPPATPEWQMDDSVDTISYNDEKELWEYVHIEPDQSSDSFTAPETPESSNKNKRKKESFESMELLLDKPDEESIQQEQEQLKLLCELSESVDAFYRCTLCPQQYTTLYLLARHLERLHNVILDRARNKLQYVKNTTKHERRYRCNYCDQKYVNPTCLRKHILKHGPDGSLRCKCACCDKHFMTQEEKHQHELEQHRDRLECKVCQKRFIKPQQLVRHTRDTHNSTEGKYRNMYMCSQCSKKFPSKMALSDHERAACGTSPIYPCDKCDKRYSSYNSLKMHQMLHENQLPFVCCFCGKKFNTKGQQKVHERSHTGEKPFRCDECKRAFSYRESLVTHLSTHTGVKRYGCADCDRRFSCTANLQAHRRVHHKAMGGGTGTPKSDLKTGEN